MFAFSGISLTGRLWAISASHASNKAIVQDFSGLYPLGLSETSQIFLWNAPTEQRQKPLTFHYQTGWLIGISYFMAYYTVTPLYLGSFFFHPLYKATIPSNHTIPYQQYQPTNQSNQRILWNPQNPTVRRIFSPKKIHTELWLNSTDVYNMLPSHRDWEGKSQKYPRIGGPQFGREPLQEGIPSGTPTDRSVFHHKIFFVT